MKIRTIYLLLNLFISYSNFAQEEINTIIEISPQTIIVGVDCLYFAPKNEIIKNKTIIYITPNTVFYSREKLEGVIFYNYNPVSDFKCKNNKTVKKKNVEKQIATTCSNTIRCLGYSGSVPIQKRQLVTIGLTTSVPFSSFSNYKCCFFEKKSLFIKNHITEQIIYDFAFFENLIKDNILEIKYLIRPPPFEV